jgi:serine/threonine protein kinase
VFPGRIINQKYRILRVLGRGGMGVVSEALCLETGEKFAIKFLREDVESDLQPMERFAREARLASPHTCRLIDIDEWELGPFIVMELLDGRPLSAALIPGSPFKWQQAARIAYEVCVALGEAHRLGIVHRDIKPANIFLAWSSRQRAAVKVLDFGVAKVPANVLSASGGPSLTDAALLLGTPAYVAPEQLTNSKMVDARADVWALGVVMYEMLSGRLPFSSPLVPKLLLMIAREDPPDLAVVAPHVPDALRQIVSRCLLKDPALRFPDADAVRVALDEWRDADEELLVPLLRQASLRPLRLLSSHPPAAPDHDEPIEQTANGHRFGADSIGPQTTARIARPPRQYARWHAIVAGAVVSFAAAVFGVGVVEHGPGASNQGNRVTETRAPAAPPHPLENARGTTVLLVRPETAAAVLELDGKRLPTNPFVVTEADPHSDTEHVLRITAPGFLAIERRFHVGEAAELVVTLQSDPHALDRRPASKSAPRQTPSSAISTVARTGSDAPPAQSYQSATKSAGASGSRSAPLQTRQLDPQNPF